MEEYDLVEDFQTRKNMIINEVKKLNNMANSDFNSFLNKCQDNVEYNYNLLKQKVENKLFSDWST